MRTFSGSEQFEALKKTVVDNYTKLFPVIKSTDPNKPDYSLHLKKIWVDETGLDTNDFPSQKKARLSGNTWGAPVYADIELRDPTGKVADHMSKIRLSTIPKITPRGSYIVGGNEYQVSNQLRKKPGVYVRRRATGDQFKADFSMKDGDLMRNFEVHYDPITAKYKTKIGQSEMPLYTMLHSLGASDDQLRKEWGAEVFAANKVDPSKHVLKLADKFARVSTNNIQTAKEAIQNYANKLQSDPSINEITLGKNHKNLSTAMIIDASKKLKDVYHEKAEPDDPENLLFKEVLSTEDMLHDVLSNQKQQDKLKYALTRQLGRKTKIKDIIDFKKLSSPVETFFTRDNRSGTPEQYNPVHMLSEAHKLTIMGTGGINNPHAITNDIREVHPSHVGFIDPVHTPEGEKVGVTLHLTAGAIKDGRDIRTPAINARTGKMELLTPKQLYSKVVAFPDEAAHNNGKLTFNSPDKVNAQQQGKLRQYKSTEVEYILPSKNALFSHSTNLIPFLHSDQGNRAMMAAKHLGQAIPLVHREAPLVQTDMFGGKTFQEAIGKEFSVVAPVDGKITAIENGYIHIGKTRIPLYHDFPLNQKTYLHHEPNVKVGDVVKKGQLLADSNFTSKGTLALGKNLNVAYLPYPGLTFDDGIVITESAAKKLSAQSITKHTFDVEAGNKESHLNKFIGFYPNSVPKSKHASFDSEGVIKKGTVVNPDDVLIMGLKYELNSPENMTARRINKALMKPWANKAVHYKGEFPGVVSDVIKRADHIDVYVKSVEPAKESDKLSGVHGNKGVITKIIPDHEAPKTADGKIPDVFLNPHGVIGRINLGQIYESAAGKIAEKTGKPYIVKNFSDTKTNQTIANEMKSHGISDMEEMFLPNGKSLGKVHMGKPYILRLASTGKKGFSARTPGAGYDLNLQPTKGGEEGAKALDLMTFYSMLSHGAKKNLIDAHQKSEKNDEYWHAIESGLPLPPPKTTFAFNKFVGMLKGAGINVIDKDSNLYLAPMTDAAVKRISNGAIKEPVFFSAKNMKEKDGGFFDPILTGGKQGNKFTHIELREPLPNPVFEKPIMALTGLDSKSYADIVSGIKSVAVGSKQLTGGAAIQHLLKQIDVTKSITDIGNQLKTTKTVSQVDALNKKLRYLHALKELNLKPEEANVRTIVPVIPPAHRPVLDLPGKVNSVAPINHLYQNLGVLTKSHDLQVMKYLDDTEKKDLRQDTYKATRAVAGLEPVITRGTDQPIEGLISQITGSQPKAGFFLSKIIDKKQDLVGRGVITAAPDYHVDQLGVPEKMAWKIFSPFIIREYTSSGIGADVARKEMEQKTPRAKQMLESVMRKRTVLLNRAPSLHKFSIMAFKPVLTDGLTLKIPPLVLKGFSGDFDGDACTVHVPTSEEALRESYKMLPSNNLFKPGTGELMMVPTQEAAIGLYFLSHTPEGRKKINSILPQKFHINGALDKAEAGVLYNKIGKEDPKSYSNLVHELKKLGDHEAYERGFTVGLKDTVVDTKGRDRNFAQADLEVAKLKRLHKTGPELDKQVAAVYQKAAKTSFDEIQDNLKKSGNSFYHMVRSGARGNPAQLQQIITAPGIVEDSKSRPVPVPLKTSYAEGLKTSDYFVASYGVRKGMMDKSLQTSAPGALNKDIMANTIDNIITLHDCGTKHGIEMSIDSHDLKDRVILSGKFKDQVVTPQIISALKKGGDKTVTVRSPLKCIAEKGTCAKCYGHDEFGVLPSIGDNVGARCGQAMSEPLTQLSMKTFHTGGMAGADPGAAGFERVRQLLHMPKGHVTGEAAYAKVSGKVTKITKSPVGGYSVHIGDKIHPVPFGRELKVREGDKVSIGDPLSTGVMKPQVVKEFKGMEKAQDYLVDELHKTFAGSKGISPIERRVFETVVRSVGNNTEVVKAPKHANFLPGDVIPYTTAVHYNESRKETLPVNDTVGYHLSHPVGHLPIHHEISDKDIPYLKASGYNKLDVLKDPLIHAPMIKGVERLSKTKKNWMAQLGYRYIENTLTDGAAEAWKSQISGTHPIPAYAVGTGFGKKKESY